MNLSPSDHSLLIAARADDRRAFAALIERHYRTLLGCCRRLVRDPELARDAAQEAVVRAMLGLDGLRDDDRFGAWLVGIGLNVCRSLLVARGRELSADGESAQPPGEEDDPAVVFEASEFASRIRSAVSELPPGQREAVALFYLAGLTHAEIADELGSRPGAIKTRLHKARKNLRASLHDLREEPAPMTQQPPDLISMHVAEIRRTAPREGAEPRHVVFLEDAAGGRRLPIWVGAPEATALAVQLDDVRLPRPTAYQFAASLLAAAGGSLAEVRVAELTDSTFYAQAILADGTVVDARPSDALTLALIADAPIYVHAAVLEQTERERSVLGDLIAEAENATDDARTLANEVRARLNATSEELAELRQRLT